MRAVVQRVSEAKVSVEGKTTGSISKGLLILLGIEGSDDASDLDWLAQKIVALRIFSDEEGKMNRSLLEVDGEVLVVSQFTLHAKYKKGNRPSFIQAAGPDHATPLYDEFCKRIGTMIQKPTQTGIFGAHMDVHLVNDGPVTLMLDTKNKE
jgi:D-tyrosyl-tRNA(Tyr) deacylase